MDRQEGEMRYLAVEANKTLEFLSRLKQSQRDVVLVPNLRYGLVAISPIIPILRKEGYGIYPNKIGSSESHDNPLIMGSQASLPLETLAENQPHFLIIDGTRNTGGDSRENHKYPDSQQGYLNYVIVLNDCITSQDEKAYLHLMGVSQAHVKRLRDTSQYWTHKQTLETSLKTKSITSPYSFEYWNPAGLTLALLNHGVGCAKKTESFKPTAQNTSLPTVFFVNSTMPSRYHSITNRASWGNHTPAYFDDDNQAGNFQFSFDERGVYLFSGLGKRVEQIYEEIYGGNKK